ncbi:MFS family permease [Dyadobacter sp. BE34]|uniref:MFS family permease n=1 Tax=Dyadobacter fermentans TaxID=94254 RepID=A0ABU1QZD8_9BACT|nr:MULTISPECIES: MFS transporter [Dyadobacter]MDR6806527.1 MFS family permease [Dyadobacter fermentans]MDR7044268.1 MFS family permease [Dyadobacter sp. BE242]MDR7198579.1 MFS family permease [Dyadobacter sp. BE34]MDR7216541.1 MFS family permease [Dyadobacter sp. BE31]MDR7263933.1 MFS family permease [Dyadobacter sp. BE32]
MNLQISKWLLLAIISSSVFLSVMDIFIVNVAIPHIKTGIHGTDSDIQLVIALYLLGYAAFLVTGGRAGDYFGKKKVFVVAMLLFVVTSAVCGFAQTPWELNVARFFQGVGAAWMIPQGITYIQELFPGGPERVRALGIYGSVAGSASVIGQFLGGILPETHGLLEGWRLIFLINLPIGLLVVPMALLLLPADRRGQRTGFDHSGVMLLTGALVCLIYPLIRGRELNWPLWCVAMLVAGGILLVLFIGDQKRKRSKGRLPLLDVRLFGFRGFNIGMAVVLFYFMVQDSYFLINVMVLETGLGFSSAETGMLFVFQGVGYVIASLVSLRLVPLFGKKVLQAGVAIMVVTLALHIVVLNGPEVDRQLLYPILFAYGTGCGSVLPSLLAVALKNIPIELAGAASGTFSTFQQTAIALGIGVIGGIFFSCLGPLPDAATYISAYHIATVTNMALLALVGFFLWLLPGDEPLKSSAGAACPIQSSN